MKIRKLQLKNIGVFDDDTIEFQECPEGKAEIHIFTGENGTGKTTILQVLASIFDYIEERSALDFKHFEYSRNFLYKRFREFDYLDEDYPSRAVAYFQDGDSLKIFGCPTCESIHQTRLYTHKISESSLRKLDLFKFLLVSDYQNTKLDFAAFAFSGYRQVENERVEANKELKEFNPLSQALNFIKDYSQENQLTINQLITNNISNRALAKDEGSLEEAKRYETVIKSVEQIIFEITGKKVEFVLKRQPNELKLKVDNNELDFDVLPDGLRSLISWIADLAGRIDLLKWQDDLPIFEKNLILFLDEIEVHLHPAWQRKVLPVVQKLFKNSQIFVSTHSPFVVNSIDDAWVYKLELDETGKARVAEIVESENSFSFTQVLREIFGVEEWFGLEVQNKLDEFEELKDKILANGSNQKDEKKLLSLAKSLAQEPSDQLKQIVRRELRQLSELKGKDFSV